MSGDGSSSPDGIVVPAYSVRDWHLEVAKQVSDTAHTRSTVKARDGLKKLTCAVFREGDYQPPEFEFNSLEVLTTCGRWQPAASADELFCQLFGEVGYLARRMKESLIADGCTEDLDDLGDFEYEEWLPAMKSLRNGRLLLGPWQFHAMMEDVGFRFWLKYDALVSKPADPYGWVPSVLDAGRLPSDLGPVLAQFLPKPPRPPVMGAGALFQLCEAYNEGDHDRLWHANAHVRTTCRGQRITALYLYGDYDRERWTVSHFDDGGFDLNAEEDEDGIVDHEHELEFYG